MSAARKRLALLGVLLALVAVLGGTALLGGFRTVASAPVTERVAGEQFTVGPYRIALGTAVSTPDLDAYLDKGEVRPRLLLIPVKVSTTATSFTDSSQLASVLTPIGAGAATDPDGEVTTGTLRMAADSTSVYDLNPGLTYDLVLKFEQDPKWTGDRITVDVERLKWLQDDPTGVNPQRWLYTGRTASRVELPVTLLGGAS
ncbi:hypothetical protein [Nocardioides montaniterrae]